MDEKFNHLVRRRGFICFFSKQRFLTTEVEGIRGYIKVYGVIWRSAAGELMPAKLYHPRRYENG